jgi:hypothetical protein
MDLIGQEITTLSQNPLRINGRTIIDAFKDYVGKPLTTINNIREYQRLLR